ncbi:MAG: SGNH hydrolase domain-containing protein [Acidimicrobiales bacterium]
MQSEVRSGSAKEARRTFRLSMFAVAVVVLALGAVLGVHVAKSGTPVPAVRKTTPEVPQATTVSQPIAAVACPTPSECLAVGGPGRLFASQDSADRWTAFSLPTDHYLYGITCPTSSRCVAVGDAGTILVSRHGLRGWGRVDSGTGIPLSAVTCQDPNTCTAVGDGGTILVTRDGGAHWEQTNRGTEVITGVSCGLPDECVAVTSSADQVLRTTDAAAWSGADVQGGPLLALLSMNGVFCSSPTCVSVGTRGMISVSTDNGASWSFDVPVTDQNLNGVSCSTADVCVAVGAAGTVLTTTDGGGSWTQIPSPTTQTLLGVDCLATGFCVAVGAGGTILSTGAASQPWELRAGEAVPTSNPLSVLVVGDSFAHTVALYVGRDASPYGVNLIDGGIDGCSLARGDTISLPVGGPCAPSGPGWAADYTQDLDQDRPRVVLLALGPWDLSARLIDGQWLSPAQPAYDAYYADQLMSAIQILTAGGARVVIATVPSVLTAGPELCAPPSTAVSNCPTESERVQALDEVARQVAARAPGHVTVIDLGTHLSPQGEFSQAVDGVVVRAADGVHLSEPGGEWLAPWLLPQLVAASRSPS